MDPILLVKNVKMSIFEEMSCNLISAGSGLYSSKLGTEASPGGAAPYFPSSMQSAYGQQGTI